MKGMLLAGINRIGTVAALLAGTASSVAYAQDTAAASDSSIGAAASIPDIIVTASRFSETIQRSSNIISVINPDKLVGITDVRQLQTVDPGVQLGVSGGITNVFVRGVGSFNVQNNQSASVSFNVDGVSLYTSTMITPSMYDIERIEVLKGPQGTLYGRNASGGVVNVITNGAKLGAVEGYVEGEFGNYDQRRLTGALNLPLGETLAVRLAAQHTEHDGYLSDGSDDQDQTTGRIRVRWEPSSAVTLKIGADVARIRSVGPGASPNPNPTDDKFIGLRDPRLAGTPFGLLALPPYAPAFYDSDQWSVHAELEADLGFATLTVLPAYRDEDLRYRSYTPGFENSEAPHSKQTSVEVRLANRSDALRWVAGAYYFNISQSNNFYQRAELIFVDTRVPDYKQKIRSYALFGEANFSVTESFRLIGGLRYTHERTRASASVNNMVAFQGGTPAYNPFDPVTNPTGEFLDYPFAGSTSAEAVTWKAGAEMDVGPASMIFATASRGFKGGGLYVERENLDSSFKPEFVTAFELGSRNRLADNKLQVNAGIFYWNLKDQQVPYLTFNANNQITIVTANAGKAHMYGANLDVVWQAGPNDVLRGSAEYLKSEYDEFSRIIPAASIITPTACQLSNYAPGTFNPAVMDCAGQPLIRAPKWALSAGYQHRFKLHGEAEILADFDMTYASRRVLSPDYAPNSIQSGRALFNAALTYNAGPLTLRGWMRNIANTRVASGGGATVPILTQLSLQPPRIYGVSARYAF